MTSRVQHKHAQRSAFQKTVAIVLFLGAIGLLNYFQINPFSNISQTVASTVWKVKEGTQRELNDFYSLLQSKRALVLENNRLKQELLDSEHIRITEQALQQENEELKQMLGRDIVSSTTLAAVLSRPGTSPYDTLVIDVGTRDNVQAGDQVIALGDFAVGFVSKVFSETSQVTFYSSPGVKTNVFIGENSIPASAQGRGANNFIVQLPRDAEVSVGDIVTLSDFETQVFAVVEEITRDSNDAFQLVLFKNPVNIFNTKWVQVVTEPAL